MTHNIEEILEGFSSLAEFRDFLNEKINSGEEISKGKNPDETSKVEKTKENPDMANPEDLGQEDEGGPEGLQDPEAEMEEGPGPGIAPGPEGAEAPPMDPSAAPGSQIAIGNKVIKNENDPRPVRIKVSGEKQKLDMKPRIATDVDKTSPNAVA